jgi:D-lactate dehydrogenase
MPRPGPRALPHTTREGAAAICFPACINRIFGRDPGHSAHPSLPQALADLSARAGQPVWIPPDVTGLCCSTPWSSKGYTRGHKWMAAATCDAMWRWSDHGASPVVIDAASCTNGLLDDVKNHLIRALIFRVMTDWLLAKDEPAEAGPHDDHWAPAVDFACQIAALP